MVLRVVFGLIFVAVIISVLLVNLSSDVMLTEDAGFLTVALTGIFLTLAVLMVDIFTPKKKLNALAGIFFGLLVGMLISVGMAFIIEMITKIYNINIHSQAVETIKWITGICICYLTISIVIRTKDDVRFVIPYVEFSKQTKGVRPLILDTSAIIDGRIADLCQAKFIDAALIVPRFVLNELQLISDSADKLKRNRGRRGLDILKQMQENSSIEIGIDDTIVTETDDVKGVDQKLVVFTKFIDGRLVTTDYNLSKVAQVREVDVLNINDLANSLKAIALPGEMMQIKVIKPGEEADQGVGYLEDGTMVVVEGARNKIGKDILISITSSLQTSAGKMIFGKFEGFADKNKRQ